MAEEQQQPVAMTEQPAVPVTMGRVVRSQTEMHQFAADIDEHAKSTQGEDGSARSVLNGAVQAGLLQFPWTCEKCSTENASYPSICDSCDAQNPNYYGPGILAVERAIQRLPQDYGKQFHSVFPRKQCPILLPVVHVYSAEQTVRNVEKVFSSGCDGVWLIDHNRGSNILPDCFKAARDAFPDKWIGVNVLKLMMNPTGLFQWVAENCPTANGIWSDNSFVGEGGEGLQARIKAARKSSGWEGLYFAGVAFKYQQKVHAEQDADALPNEAKIALMDVGVEASKHMDCVITSSSGTGVQASHAKLRAMGAVARPIAVSGVGNKPEELEQFVREADVFLAATALSCECQEHKVIDKCESSFGELDKEKLTDWVKTIHELKLE
eukprot:TRINITY_DN22837_c0_g1_i1.p1 TRINITY_DN22837_c0_g1~~TRINITY_DN22837_c0_g1_i1.p1  ORF type:complete len:380 (-),score=65.85 TRINITY_DN22837_c0_g1_i1:77-1216(-)